MRFWTKERTDALKRYVGEGFSGTEIGLQLGCSRNSVISKTNRAGLQLKGRPLDQRSRTLAPKPRGRPPKTAQQRADEARSPVPLPAQPLPPTIGPTPTSRPCSILDFTNSTCRWPITEGSPWLFCGAPEADLAGGCAYCAVHAAVAFNRRAA